MLLEGGDALVAPEVRKAMDAIVEAARHEGPVARPDHFDPRPTTPSLLDRVEERILRLGGTMVREKGGSPPFLPVTHRFTPGLYIREIFMPAGAVLTSKIHMTEHPYTVSQGLCMVFGEGDGWREVKAPYTGITYPGTRRLLVVLRDTVWTTYHPTTKTTVAEVEDEIILDYHNPLLAGPGEIPEEASV